VISAHYFGLFAAYGALVVATLAVVRLTRGREGESARGLWPATGAIELKRPWVDLGLFFVAVAAVIGVGQLYVNGMLLPETGPVFGLIEAVNQFLIFSPVLLLLLIRRQSLATALLPRGRVGLRLLAGFGLALVAALAYSLARRDFGVLVDAFAGEAGSAALGAHAVQVFMEDVAIAALLVRLSCAIRTEWGAGALVAALFAAGHLPAMLAGDDPVTGADIVALTMDFGIGLVVMIGLLRTRDVLWLFPTHFVMDVAQFGG